MLDSAERAVEQDKTSATAQSSRGYALFMDRRREEATAAWRRAVERSPHDAHILGDAGFFLAHMGDFESSRPLLDKAISPTPFPPHWFYFGLFHTNYHLGEFQEAADALHRIDDEPNNYWIRLFLAVCYVELDRLGRVDVDCPHRVVRVNC